MSRSAVAPTTRRTAATTTSRRATLDPVGGTTIHVIGDSHAYVGFPLYKYDALSADVRTAVARPPLHFQIGDNTDDGLTAEDPMFSNLMARLPATWYNAIGNHDVLNQTVASWEAKWGHSRNFVVDLPGLRLIAVGGDDGSIDKLSVATLAFLDTSLGATTNPCFVMSHYPLYNTVAGDSTLEFTSTQALFWCGTAASPSDSSDILAILAAHTNVKAWISGHTHTHLNIAGLVMPVVAGSVRFASINVSSPWYQGKTLFADTAGPLQSVHTAFVTWLPAGRVEVRFRNHIAGQWVAPNGSPVFTVTGL